MDITSHSSCRPVPAAPVVSREPGNGCSIPGGGADVRPSLLSMIGALIAQAYREGVLLDTIFDVLVLGVEYGWRIAWAVWCGVEAVLLKLVWKFL